MTQDPFTAPEGMVYGGMMRDALTQEERVVWTKEMPPPNTVRDSGPKDANEAYALSANAKDRMFAKLTGDGDIPLTTKNTEKRAPPPQPTPSLGEAQQSVSTRARRIAVSETFFNQHRESELGELDGRNRDALYVGYNEKTPPMAAQPVTQRHASMYLDPVAPEMLAALSNVRVKQANEKVRDRQTKSVTSHGASDVTQRAPEAMASAPQRTETRMTRTSGSAAIVSASAVGASVGASRRHSVSASRLAAASMPVSATMVHSASRAPLRRGSVADTRAQAVTTDVTGLTPHAALRAPLRRGSVADTRAQAATMNVIGATPRAANAEPMRHALSFAHTPPAAFPDVVSSVAPTRAIGMRAPPERPRVAFPEVATPSIDAPPAPQARQYAARPELAATATPRVASVLDARTSRGEATRCMALADVGEIGGRITDKFASRPRELRATSPQSERGFRN